MIYKKKQKPTTTRKGPVTSQVWILSWDLGFPPWKAGVCVCQREKGSMSGLWRNECDSGSVFEHPWLRHLLFQTHKSHTLISARSLSMESPTCQGCCWPSWPRGPATLSLSQAQTGTKSVPCSVPLTRLGTTWTTQGDSRDTDRKVQENKPLPATGKTPERQYSVTSKMQ